MEDENFYEVGNSGWKTREMKNEVRSLIVNGAYHSKHNTLHVS
jgi:hypothetical protein